MADKKFSYKIFKQSNDILLAISDASIVGKTLDKELELTVSKEFYSEKSCDEEEAIELLKSATIVNAIGKEIIDLMKKRDFIKKENILYISDVPHAQLVVV